MKLLGDLALFSITLKCQKQSFLQLPIVLQKQFIFLTPLILNYIEMLRQYYSVNLNAKKEEQKSFIEERRHRLAGNKISIINERVQKIKNKYGPYSNLKGNFLNSYSMMLDSELETNKENQSLALNCSVIQDGQIKKTSLKQSKTRKAKKSTRDLTRIQELQQINLKINKIIENLKCQEESQDKYQESSHMPMSLVYPIHPENKPNALSSTKHSFQSRRSRVKAESLDRYRQSNRSHSSLGNRENGKLSKPQSISKSYKQLKYLNQTIFRPDRIGLQLSKQVQLDQKFMKDKASLIRMGNKCRQLLQEAVEKCNFSVEEKLLILEWNFDDVDPLYTERNHQSSTQCLDQNILVYQAIDSFIKCQDHWMRRLVKKFTRKQLKLKDLDLEQKGYFLKQDLTRFLSLQTKKMYCNRHISLIFKRVNRKKNKIVPTQDLINILCL